MGCSTFSQWFVEHFQEISIGFLVFHFFIYLFYRVINNKNIEFLVLLGSSISTAFIPAGIAFILCAYCPKLFITLENSRYFMAVAGIALICISLASIYRTLFQEKRTRKYIS